MMSSIEHYILKNSDCTALDVDWHELLTIEGQATNVFESRITIAELLNGSLITVSEYPYQTVCNGRRQPGCLGKGQDAIINVFVHEKLQRLELWELVTGTFKRLGNGPNSILTMHNQWKGGSAGPISHACEFFMHKRFCWSSLPLLCNLLCRRKINTFAWQTNLVTLERIMKQKGGIGQDTRKGPSELYHVEPSRWQDEHLFANVQWTN
jgi:hypothetical protein